MRRRHRRVPSARENLLNGAKTQSAGTRSSEEDTVRRYRADLHVHSSFSNRPSIWALRRFNCPESYTSPEAIYEMARKRGMDYVTITDHNTIDGVLQISHLPGTFLGSELTSYFPENGCKVHMVVLGFSESQFADLLSLRKNIYELVAYARSADLAHFQSHPLYDINGRLSVEMVEKFLLLFNTFEARNGARARHYNELFACILGSLDKETMERLADRHGLEPWGDQSWVKGVVGGSDDHSGLFMAQTFTETTEGATPLGFLRSVRSGGTLPGGDHGTALTLAHSIYAVAYQFLGRQVNSRRLRSYPFLGALLESITGNGEGLSRSTRLKLAVRKALPEIYAGSDKRGLEEIIDQEVKHLVNDKAFLRRLTAESLNKRIFICASHIANRLLYTYTKKLMDGANGSSLMQMIESLSTIGFVHLITSPYYIAHHSQNRSKDLMADLRRTFLPLAPATSRQKMALFTDTLDDVNGVSLTIKRLLAAAPEHGTDLVVMTCSERPSGRSGNVMNFQGVGDFRIPEYDEMRLHFPPVLDVLQCVSEEGFTRIHVSTPGTQGLLGLLAAKLLDLPVSGTYHTDIPRYVGYLTDDPALENTAWDYIIWFYNQLDEVLVPSSASREQLLARGLLPAKVRPLPRWVDTERFSPSHADPGLWGRFPAARGVKFLYAGRVSREKNLDVLVEAFRALERSGPPLCLVVAGDGPYRAEMEAELKGHAVIFTGFLPQDDLARVYASADVFVFPSTTDTFGNVVLEAQASGIPVVVTDQGGPQELVLPQRSGLIVPGGDAEALALAMRFLAEHPEQRVAMGGQARRFVVESGPSVTMQFSTVFGTAPDQSWSEHVPSRARRDCIPQLVADAV